MLNYIQAMVLANIRDKSWLIYFCEIKEGWGRERQE
jgi:hypothetical protein